MDNSARVVRTITCYTNSVTPVLVNGGHFSARRNPCGTMDTGDKRRYDTVVFCRCLHVDINVGSPGQQ